jgi:hypothetical protein
MRSLLTKCPETDQQRIEDKAAAEKEAATKAAQLKAVWKSLCQSLNCDPAEVEQELQECDQLPDKAARFMCSTGVVSKIRKNAMQDLKDKNPELFSCLASEPLEDPNCGDGYHEACGHIHNEWVSRCQELYGK